MRRSALIGALVVALVLQHSADARADVSADKQALIMVRILAYDHALPDRAGSLVRIGVIHAESAPALACASRMRKALDKLVGRVTIGTLPIEVQTVGIRDATAPALAQRKLSVAYVCRGSETELDALVIAARASRVLTVTDEIDYLQRGLSIALTDDAPRIGIAVNLDAARSEGARMGAQLLRLSKVVKR